MLKEKRSALDPNGGERELSDRLQNLTTMVPWIPIMLIATAIYIIFSCLTCLFRPAFWDI